MTVKEVIENLKLMPLENEVFIESSGDSGGSWIEIYSISQTKAEVLINHWPDGQQWPHPE